MNPHFVNAFNYEMKYKPGASRLWYEYYKFYFIYVSALNLAYIIKTRMEYIKMKGVFTVLYFSNDHL